MRYELFKTKIPASIKKIIILFFIFNTSFAYCYDRFQFIHAESAIRHEHYAYITREIDNIKINLTQMSLPDWMLANIKKEFQEFLPFSPEDLEQYFFESKQSLVHFRIRDGVLYFRCNDEVACGSHALLYAAVFHRILKQEGHQILTGDFLLDLADGAGAKKAPYPILCFSKYHTSNCISIPDWFAVGERKEQLMLDIDQASNRFSWDKKINQAFWIGPAHGGNFEGSMWKINNRSQLVLFSLAHPDLLWARFTHIKDEEHIFLEMRKLDDVLCAERIPEVNAVKYKYLIDADGYSSSFYRPQWILRSNCVLIKEDSGNVQWHYSGLKPYVNYIPYKTDCSDLAEIITWIREHDEQARNIAIEGKNFASQYLNANVTYLYLSYVLKEYANLNHSARMNHYK